MKTIFFFFVFILTYCSVEGQTWTSPIPLTDSNSDNSNPLVVVWEDEVYMIYNKYSEPYRQIWWRKISEPMSEEQMLVGGWPEVDYRNPQIVSYDFLVCEINIGGQYDLFGFRFDTTGILDSGFQLTNTGFDENSFYGYSNYYSEICCWESEGKIYVAQPLVSQDTLILTNITLVDSGNCFNPICQADYIVWRKIENSESHIYYSENMANQWSFPLPVVDTGNNINLSISSSLPEFGGLNLWWQSQDQIFYTELYNVFLSSPELPGIQKYFEPTAFEFALVTDYFVGLYSFAGESESVRDIYVVDEAVKNISNDAYINKNPCLFLGPNMYGNGLYKIFNIWQTEINGHDVLFGSSAVYQVIIGNSCAKEIAFFNISPNPVSSGSTIQINFSEVIADDYTISILNIHGHLVDDFKEEKNHSNEIVIKWNKVDLAAGVYFLVVKTKNKTTTEKFIVL